MCQIMALDLVLYKMLLFYTCSCYFIHVAVILYLLLLFYTCCCCFILAILKILYYIIALFENHSSEPIYDHKGDGISDFLLFENNSSEPIYGPKGDTISGFTF